MVTANELLYGVSAVDKTLIISNDLRTIAIPSSVKNLGVESDDDVLRLNFKMPRYIGNIDLSVFSIRINYLNAEGEGDIYTVSDAVSSSEYITFSWLVGPNATKYKGDTKFNICMRTTLSDGTVDREYNTTIASLPVLEGLEVDEGYLETYTDLLEQWRRELFGIGDTEEAAIRAVSKAEQEAIANKGAEVLATIPEDYATAVSMTDNADRTKADAIICSAQGETISVADSSDDYIRALKIFGKTTQVSTTGIQLLNNTNTTLTTNGITFTSNEDGSISIFGTASDHAYYLFDFQNDIPVKNTELIASISGHNKVSMVIGYFTDVDTFVNEIVAVNSSTTKTFTYPNEATATRTFLAINAGTSIDATVYPLLRLSSINSSVYEPYSGGVPSPSPEWPQELMHVGNDTAIQTKLMGKNFVNIHDTPSALLATTATVDGESVTVTTTDDSTLSRAVYKVDYPLNVPLRLSFDATILQLDPTGAGSTVRLRKGARSVGIIMLDLNAVGVKKHYDVTISPLVEEGYDLWLYLRTFSGATGTISVKFENIQIEIGDATTGYDPYKNPQVLMSDRTLAGIPVTSGGNYTDDNGQQWICDEIDFERGVYIQRCKTETLTFEPEVNDYGTRYVCYGVSVTPHQLCTVCMCPQLAYSPDVGLMGPYTHNGIRITPTYRGGTVVARWDDAVIESLTVTYLRATPLETPLTAEEINAFQFAHTNFPNTTVLNDAGAWMELKYNADTKTYLDNCFRPTDEQVQTAVNRYLTENPVSGATFVDTVTGKPYQLSVINGKLTLV